MHHLSLLGRLELTSADDQSVRSVLAQPRRLAVLAYVALVTRRRPVPRETLLDLLWPDASEERARGGLRQALHFLRKSLGPDVIQSDETQALFVDTAHLQVDALAFQAACDNKEWETALELYRGELLPGFYLDDVVDFEHWLDRERERLARLAREAAWAASDAEEAKGNSGLAIHFGNRAMQLAPYSEADLLRLVQLLQDHGQAGNAATLVGDYIERLSADLETEASPEVIARLTSLQQIATAAALPVPSPAPSPHAGPPSIGAAPTGAAATPVAPTAGAPSAAAPTARRTTALPLPAPTLFRRPASKLVPAALVVAAAIAWNASRGPAVIGVGSQDVVAVMPFTYSGDGELSFLSDGVVSLIGVGLSGAGQLQAIDARAILARTSGDEPQTLDEASSLAAGFGAGAWVMGQIVERGNTVVISAALHIATDPPNEVRMEVSRTGEPGKAIDLVGEVTVGLMEELLGSDFSRRGVAITSSVPAAKAFAAGEEAYRQGRFLEAADHFRDAVAADSVFALAYYRLSLAVSNAGAPGGGEAIQKAFDHAHNLVPLDRDLLDAWNMQRRGQILEADRWYRTLVARRPTDVEAWFRLGEVAYHWAGTVGLRQSDALVAFEQVLALEPDNGNAVFHAARIAGRQGRLATLDSLTDRMIGLDGNVVWTNEARLGRAWALGDEAEAAEVETWLLAQGPNQIVNGFAAALVTSERFEPALRFLGTWSRQAPAEPRVTLWKAHLLAASGRMALAFDALDMGGLSPERALENKTMLATIPGIAVSEATLRGLLVDLQSLADVMMPPRDDRLWRGAAEAPPLAWDGLEFRHRRFLIAMIALRLGDTSLADAQVASLRETEGRGLLFARIIQARRALLDGDATGALDALGPPENPDPPIYEAFTDYARTHARLLRAELLGASNRAAEALAWYETFPDANGRDTPFVSTAHLARARLLEARGEAAAAAEQYQWIARVWAEADEPMRSVAVEARAAVARLSPQG